MRRLLGIALCLAAASATADPNVAMDYAIQCQGCHLANGRGSGDIPTLHGIGALFEASGGRAYLARVPGVANASLSDERLAALLNWVLTRWSQADFAPYTEDEVGQLRRQPLLDPAAAREALTTDKGAPSVEAYSP